MVSTIKSLKESIRKEWFKFNAVILLSILKHKKKVGTYADVEIARIECRNYFRKSFLKGVINYKQYEGFLKLSDK